MPTPRRPFQELPPDPDAAPFNALPAGVVVLIVLIAGVEAAVALSRLGLIGAGDLRLMLVRDWAFSGPLLRQSIATGTALPDLVRLVSYGFVHAAPMQALFVVVFVLALGKMVGETLSSGAVIAAYLIASAAGALAYGLLLSDARLLIGGFPGAYGLIGVWTFVLWLGYGAAGAARSRAFSLIAMLMGIQLLFGLIFGGTPDWVADLAGFAAGFALAPVLAPGGIGRVIARLRR